ncbi:MAG: hypothetical protein ACI9KE_000600 [Polyangiales bacterium]|jgi:hypothetical protein
MLRYHLLFNGTVLTGHSRGRAEVVLQASAKDESLEPSNDAQQLLFEPISPLEPIPANGAPPIPTPAE